MEDGVMARAAGPEQHDVIVIGAGQSGLAASYHLAAADIDHVLLERDARVGDVWRSRYDSLRLYSPARYDALPGLPFPIDPLAFPTGRQMGDYLEAYVRHFELPVRTGVTVRSLRGAPDGYELSTNAGAYLAQQVILATGHSQRAYVPAFAEELDDRIKQLHSADYRGPDQLPDGPALVIGASHSGADSAFELATTRPTFLVGRSHGQLPFSVDGRVARYAWPLMKAIATKLLSLRTPIGRKMAPLVRSGGAPLLRHRKADLERAGVDWIEERVVGVSDGKPQLADGRVLDVASIVWCTGFRPDFSWIEPSIVEDGGWPAQERGVVTASPGLYVLGIPFLHSFASMLVVGAGADAAHVVGKVRAPRPATTAAA
jgi:putative flavoprotein involved in K+ transport